MADTTAAIDLLRTLGNAPAGGDGLDTDVCAYLGMRVTAPVTTSIDAGLGIVPGRCWVEIVRNSPSESVARIGEGDQMFARAVGDTPALALAGCLVACRQRHQFTRGAL